VPDALLLTQLVFFWDIHVFLQLSWIGLFVTQWAFLHLKNSDFQEVFIAKTNTFFTENNVLDATASNIEGSLERYMGFFNSGE
jgi:hypothetical protein